MTAVREKAQGYTRQIIGSMIGDDLLVREGKQQQQHAEAESEADLPDDPAKLPSGDRSG